MVVAAGSVYSGSLLTSGTWTTARVKIARPLKAPRLGGRGYACLTAASRSGSTLWCAARCKSCPSKRITRPLTASHSRAAFAAMASNTGWMSPGELLMTRRISLVAVCCSCASVKERCKSAYGGAGWALPSGCRKGVPHASQNFAAARFSCWHRGHVMPEPPSGRSAKGRNRGPRLTAWDSHGQEHGHRGHAWGWRVPARGSHTCASRLPTVNQVVPLHLGKVAPTFWVRSLPPLLDSPRFEQGGTMPDPTGIRPLGRSCH